MTATLNLFRLEGKVALVSGGAGIVGAQIVCALAEAGATVIAAARSKEPSQRIAAQLLCAGYSAENEVCDFSSEPELLDLRNRILSKHARLDVLVNNAVTRAGGELFETSAEDWERAMTLNAKGLFLASRLFAEVMQQQNAGSIINIASIYGMVGPQFAIYEGTQVRNSVAYSFAKGGMINLTRYLAAYLGPSGVRVNCLSPGGFATGETPPRFLANYSARAPLGRMARGEDIRGAVVFLASDASAYVTGQNIVVDGGWTAV